MTRVALLSSCVLALRAPVLTSLSPLPGDEKAAKVRFDEAVASESGNAELRGARGMFLQKLGRSKDAREDLDLALAQKPEQLDWRASRAAALRDLDLIDDAVRDCNVVLAGRPCALKTRLLRGIMHAKRQVCRLCAEVLSAGAHALLRPVLTHCHTAVPGFHFRHRRL